jgi:hypothetical protein
LLRRCYYLAQTINIFAKATIMNAGKTPMTPERRKTVLLAVVPALLAPFSGILARDHQPRLFLGLSSQFWAGALIGISIVALGAAAYRFRKISGANLLGK